MLICFLLSFCFLRQSGYCKEKDIEKRLLLNDPETILAELKTMNVKLNELNIKVASLETDNTNLKHQISKEIKGGSTYIRWGRKDCPILNGTYLVYTGVASGGSYGETGSGTDFLCLPHDPDFAPPDFPAALEHSEYKGRIWGAEFQFSYGNVKVNDDVPCALCMDTSSSVSIMIPAKKTCPTQWRKHYSGFLTANYFAHRAASEYACVDEDPQFFEGRRSNLDGKLFYPVVTVCGSLPCPPYEDSKYLKCVVCSK